MLTPRLKCIADHVRGGIIADIGTDHAYIPIYLIENGAASRVIATDIREGPADTARVNIAEKELGDSIEVRLGNGLSVIKRGEADIIIIAGMGGQLISEIIAEGIETAKSAKLVLQPMNAQYELRKYLIKNGFKITDEDIAVEGIKVYNIIIAESGDQEGFASDFEYQIPHYLIPHRHFKSLYEKKMREFTKVTKGLVLSDDTDKEKLKKYTYWLDTLKGIGKEAGIS